MALVNCPKCNAQISDASPKCPHCNYALRSKTLVEGAFTGIRKLFFFICLLGATFGIFYGYDHKEHVLTASCALFWIGAAIGVYRN
jgi:hypothetical protein